MPPVLRICTGADWPRKKTLSGTTLLSRSLAASTISLPEAVLAGFWASSTDALLEKINKATASKPIARRAFIVFSSWESELSCDLQFYIVHGTKRQQRLGLTQPTRRIGDFKSCIVKNHRVEDRRSSKGRKERLWDIRRLR